MKVYLLALGSTLKFEDVKQYIDGQESIIDWFCSMPNSIFLVSDMSATEIYEGIRSKFNEGRLFLTEVSPQNRQGWLPRPHWEKIKQYQSST